MCYRHAYHGHCPTSYVDACNVTEVAPFPTHGQDSAVPVAGTVATKQPVGLVLLETSVAFVLESSVAVACGKFKAVPAASHVSLLLMYLQHHGRGGGQRSGLGVYNRIGGSHVSNHDTNRRLQKVELRVPLWAVCA